MESPSLRITRMLLFVIPFVKSLSNHPHPHKSNASDQQAPLGFLSAVTGYDPLLTWKPNVSFCKWTGVICSRRRQRVVYLNVSSTGLQEYGLGGRVTTKGDVYSYGIKLLEMFTGKKPTHNMFVEGLNLQNWVGNDFPNRLGEVVDKSLLRRTSTSIEEDKELKCLSQLISVGLLCTKDSPEKQPTMIDIVGTLQSIKDNFLGITSTLKLVSNMTHLLDKANTTHNNHNNTDKGQSSSKKKKKLRKSAFGDV